MCVSSTPKHGGRFTATCCRDVSPDYIPRMADQPSRFRRTLLQVMSVQVVALLLLWWLQARYAN